MTNTAVRGIHTGNTEAACAVSTPEAAAFLRTAVVCSGPEPQWLSEPGSGVGVSVAAAPATVSRASSPAGKVWENP